MDAVVAEVATDATVGTPTEIYLVPSGGKIAGQPVFRADKVAVLRAIWENDHQLLIKANSARVFRQTPSVTSGKTSIVVRYEIEDEIK